MRKTFKKETNAVVSLRINNTHKIRTETDTKTTKGGRWWWRISRMSKLSEEVLLHKLTSKVNSKETRIIMEDKIWCHFTVKIRSNKTSIRRTGITTSIRKERSIKKETKTRVTVGRILTTISTIEETRSQSQWRTDTRNKTNNGQVATN